MRHVVLFGMPVMLCAALTGCAGSGYYAYLGHTMTLPGANPNLPAGQGDTYNRVRAQPNQAEASLPMRYEAGDVWPGPPKPPPTLKDLQRQQSQELGGNTAGNGGLPGTVQGGSSLLAPLPTLPGYEIPQQEIRRPAPQANLPEPSLSGGAGAGALNGEGSNPNPSGKGNIVVPNGNGTSTVIGPNGTVTTIPTPGK